MKHNLSAEWFKQSKYDFDTALYMFKGDRNIYAVFMCHLSIEKALKGLFVYKIDTVPPRTHDLLFLCKKIKIKLSGKYLIFIENLNELSVPTRYPDEIGKLIKQYNKTRTRDILKSTKELLLWIKKLKKKQ